MKYNFLIIVCLVSLLSCSKEKTIELPLSQKNGYGYFHPSLSGMSPYPDNENSKWRKTYLKVSGAPENWTDIKIGDIETNIYQSVYQNYIHGNITKEWYEDLQKSWNWKPDTLELSKEYLKTKIAFAYTKDSTGVVKVVVDANNNLDFSDDAIFTPYNIPPNKNSNYDSLAQTNTINVYFERFIDNKKVSTNAPLFIANLSQYNMLMYNFSQYSTTSFKGTKIDICSDGFTNLSYKNPSIALIGDSLKIGDKVNIENLMLKNEYIEIEETIYKNIGINQNSLVLEQVNTPKNQLQSSQIGFKSFPFDGSDFTTESEVSLNELKGKYVLLDFWATWCGPCIQEIPNLKELYKKTDKDKFEIVGIVGDSPTDELKKIIEKDSITWTQVLSTSSNNIKKNYGVHGYPTTFLVNPEGIIIAKNLRGQELEEKIVALLNTQSMEK